MLEGRQPAPARHQSGEHMETMAIRNIEECRQQEQTRLDSLKSSAERNKWGQFATPPELALSIARYARDLLERGSVRFLDPAVGTGSFYSALSQVFLRESIEAATGIEIDPLFSETAATAEFAFCSSPIHQRRDKNTITLRGAELRAAAARETGARCHW